MRTGVSIALVLAAIALASAMPVSTHGERHNEPHVDRSHSPSQPLTAPQTDQQPVYATWPFVVHTWPWTQAADAAFKVLSSPSSPTPALDAIEAGLSVCEREQCGGTVGFGGSPDENSETTLDALIIDGETMRMGAVAALRNISNAIGVARAVMERTAHTLLAGNQATDFAVQMGFRLESLTTPSSVAAWREWRDNRCQPNMRTNVTPDPKKSCGPYKPTANLAEQSPQQPQSELSRSRASAHIGPSNHDTISMVVCDAHGRMSAGTSTNGAAHKVPGRVGDGPIPGAGAWLDQEWGGCGSTGDGDILMRFAACYQAVQNLRAGLTPRQAAEDSLARIRRFFSFAGALVVVDRRGNHGAASWGMPFSYSVRTNDMDQTEVVDVPPGEWTHARPEPDAQVRNQQTREERRARQVSTLAPDKKPEQ